MWLPIPCVRDWWRIVFLSDEPDHCTQPRSRLVMVDYLMRVSPRGVLFFFISLRRRYHLRLNQRLQADEQGRQPAKPAWRNSLALRIETLDQGLKTSRCATRCIRLWVPVHQASLGCQHPANEGRKENEESKNSEKREAKSKNARITIAFSPPPSGYPGQEVNYLS